MCQSSCAETIQHQYDAYIKKHLKGEAKSYLREVYKRVDDEVCFSELSKDEVEQLFSEDEYDFENHPFRVMGFDVYIKNELLGDALEYLNDNKRNIVLLSFFLDMSDAEIGEVLNVVRSTIFRNRKDALTKIKLYMEGKSNDK